MARVREQAWPSITDSDELHDALLLAGFLTWDELGAGAEFFTHFAAERRAMRLEIPGGAVILCATERLPELAAIVPVDPAIIAGVPLQIPPPRIGKVPCANSSAVAWSVWDRSGPRTSPAPAGLAPERPGEDPSGAGARRLRRPWPLRSGPARRAMVRTPAAGSSPGPRCPLLRRPGG